MINNYQLNVHTHGERVALTCLIVLLSIHPDFPTRFTILERNSQSSRDSDPYSVRHANQCQNVRDMRVLNCERHTNRDPYISPPCVLRATLGVVQKTKAFRANISKDFT